MKFNFEDVGCLLMIAIVVFLIGFSIYYESDTPDFEEYRVEITYCDSRPKEIKSFIVESGQAPNIFTQNRAVPDLCFCARGINSVHILNVCDFKILSQRYISE